MRRSERTMSYVKAIANTTTGVHTSSIGPIAHGWTLPAPTQTHPPVVHVSIRPGTRPGSPPGRYPLLPTTLFQSRSRSQTPPIQVICQDMYFVNCMARQIKIQVRVFRDLHNFRGRRPRKFTALNAFRLRFTKENLCRENLRKSACKFSPATRRDTQSTLPIDLQATKMLSGREKET